MRILISLGLTAGLLIACTNPIEQVRSIDSRPSVLLKDAPLSSEIYIDNLRVGLGSEYVDKAILIESGTHTVKVVSNGLTLLSEKIYVSGTGTKTLIVPGGGN